MPQKSQGVHFLEITASQTMALCGTYGAEKNPRWLAGL